MTQLFAYVHFDGRCREAMTFYKECLGGDLHLQKVSESPMAAQMPSEAGPQILHSTLTRSGVLLLLGSDCIGQPLRPGNTVSLCLSCSSDEEIYSFFDRLSAGGQVTMPLHQCF